MSGCNKIIQSETVTNNQKYDNQGTDFVGLYKELDSLSRETFQIKQRDFVPEI